MSVPVEALVRKPERLSFDEASTVGVNFVVAWYGAVETAQLAAGETIAIFGVSGGVGGAVAQIARAHRRQSDWCGPPPARAGDCRSRRHRRLRRLRPDRRRRRRDQKADRRPGVDVVYDAVGGVTTPAALAALAQRGRLVVISVVGSRAGRNRSQGPVPQRNPDLRQRTAQSSPSSTPRGACRQMAPYFESGEFRPLPIAATLFPRRRGVGLSGRRRPHRRPRRDPALTKRGKAMSIRPDRTNHYRGRPADLRHVHRSALPAGARLPGAAPA